MTTTPVLGYSYVRFSSPAQAEGDSLRRQTEAARRWCEVNDVRLDTSTTLHDLGKSAFTGAHRKNPDRHALAAFLKLVENGKVPRGSHLVIENLDRLSREHIQPALLLVLNLLQAGIRIVQLKPSEMIFDDKSDTLPVMMMMVELSRGHSESAMKSDRVGQAWAKKKQKAREDGTVLTGCLPAWIEERDGKLVLIPRKAAAVRHVLELATAGYGINAILKRLAGDKVEPIGRSGRWTHSYIGLLLKDRNVIGELQPRRRDGTPDGPAIPNYYPAVISEREWHAMRAGATQRQKKRGRAGNHVNVFAWLLHDARSGEPYFVVTNHGSNGNHRVLVNADGHEGRAVRRSFPFGVFERAVLDRLREIDPRDILNGDTGPDETMVLAGELARVESAIALIEADLDENGESPVLFRRLRDKEGEKKTLAERLAKARQESAHPLAEAWGECQSLTETIDNAADPGDVRLRLRSALRRMVDDIRLLVVPRGLDRIAAVQIWFAGGKRCRSYLILHRRPRGNASSHQKGAWWARSLAEVVRPGELDLRQSDHARRLEAALASLDLDAVQGDS
jgi:DNA invertase Pin-like site-specific DNA recombinase